MFFYELLAVFLYKKKKKLEDELEMLEGNIEQRFSGVQKKVLGTLEPLETIKQNPLKSVGTSVLIGFAIGMIGYKRSPNDEELDDLHREKFLNLFFNEFKRVAARKAATYISEILDQSLSKKR